MKLISFSYGQRNTLAASWITRIILPKKDNFKRDIPVTKVLAYRNWSAGE
jgi:hypothetical protein